MAQIACSRYLAVAVATAGDLRPRKRGGCVAAAGTEISKEEHLRTCTITGVKPVVL